MPALLLLPRATNINQTISEPSPPGTTGTHPQSVGEYLPIGAIVGGTLAGIVFVICVALAWKFRGYRLAKPVTNKVCVTRRAYAWWSADMSAQPALLLPGERFSKLSSRPSSVYSPTPTPSIKTRPTFIDTNVKINEPQPALVTPTTPTKSQKCLLRTTPMPVAGRFSPTSKLVTVHEEASPTKQHDRHSTRSRRSGSTSPIVQAPEMVELGKDSVRFPQTGAPQQMNVKHVSLVSLSESLHGHAASQRLLDEEYRNVRLSRASSAYSNGGESVRQVHHSSYISHPPSRVY